MIIKASHFYTALSMYVANDMGKNTPFPTHIADDMGKKVPFRIHVFRM